MVSEIKTWQEGGEHGQDSRAQAQMAMVSFD